VNDLQRVRNAVVLDADQKRHVALLQESSTCRDARRSEACIGQSRHGAPRVLTLRDRDHELSHLRLD
jgi:hypothetical protein